METILKYAKQPSTWRGIATVLGAVGVAISPEQVVAIGSAVAGVLAAIEMFRDEDKTAK